VQVDRNDREQLQAAGCMQIVYENLAKIEANRIPFSKELREISEKRKATKPARRWTACRPGRPRDSREVQNRRCPGQAVVFQT